MENVSLQRQKLEAQLHKARAKARAPVHADQLSRCLICREDVKTDSLDRHHKECLLELVRFTAASAASEISRR